MDFNKFLVFLFLALNYVPASPQTFTEVYSEFCNSTFTDTNIFGWRFHKTFATLVSDCGPYHLFGGYNIFTTTMSGMKNFTNLLPHYQLNLSLSILKIDLWSSTTLQIGVQIGSSVLVIYKRVFLSTDNQANLCGGSTGEYLDSFTSVFNHYDSFLVLVWNDNTLSSQSYGFFNFRLSALFCDLSCLKCTGPNANQCTECYSNAELNSATSQCSCNAQFYTVTNNPCSTPPCTVCLACNANCNGCTGPLNTDCIACMYKKYGNACYASCPSNTYESAADPSICVNSCNSNEFIQNQISCQPCDPSCLTCNGPTNAECLSCSSQKFSYQGNCYSTCPTPLWGNASYQCVAQCNKRQYGDSSDRTCKNCDPSCDSCFSSGANNCYNCLSTAFSLNGVCYLQCPEPYFGMPNKTCSGSCGQGYFTNFVDRTCLPCDSSCKTCQGITKNDCISCFGSYIIQNGTCVANCNSGYYSYNGRCFKCDAMCSNCLGPSGSLCLGCADPNLYLENYYCVSTCSSNLYQRDDKKTCEPCASYGCLECNVKWNICSKCNANFTMNYLGVCVQNVDILASLRKISEENEFIISFSHKISLSNQEISQFIAVEISKRNLVAEEDFIYSIVPFNESSYELFFTFESNITSETAFSVILNKEFLFSKHPNYILNETILIEYLSPVLICPESYMPINGTLSCVNKEIISPTLAFTYDPLEIKLKMTCVSEICINSENYYEEVLSHILTHHNLTIEPKPQAFKSYEIKLVESEETDVITFEISLDLEETMVGNYRLILNFNQTETEYFVIREDQVSIKLLDYYLLDETTKENIKGTVEITSLGSTASIISMYLNSFLQSDASFAFRLIMIIEYIYILRNIEVNYPINAIEMFRNKIEPNKVFMKHHIEVEKSEKHLIGGVLELYEISPYFINNFGELLINILIILVSAHIFDKFHRSFSHKIESSNGVFQYIMKSLHESIVWSLFIIYLSSNYLNLCYLSALNFVYPPIHTRMGNFNFFCGIICFLLSIFVLIYLFIIIKIIKENEKQERHKIKTTSIVPIMEMADSHHMFHSEEPQKIMEDAKPSKIHNSTFQDSEDLRITQDFSSHQTKLQFDETKTTQDLLPNSISPDTTKPRSVSVPLKPAYPVLPLGCINESSKEYFSNFEFTPLGRKKLEKKTSSDYKNLESIKENFEKNDSDYKNVESIKENDDNTKSKPEIEVGKNLADNSKTPKNRCKTPKESENTVKQQFGLIKTEELQMLEALEEKTAKITNILNDVDQTIVEEGINARAKLVHEIVSKASSNSTKIGFKIENTDKKEDLILKNSKRKIFKVKNFESFVGKYDIVYNDFKQNTKICHFLMIFDLARYFLIGIFVASLEDSPVTVLSLLLILNSLFVLFLLIYFPFREKLKNFLTIISELANVLATIGALIVGVCDKNEIYDASLRLEAGWMIIYANIIIVISILSTFFVMLVQSIWKIIKKIIEIKKSRTQVTHLSTCLKRKKTDEIENNKNSAKLRKQEVLIIVNQTQNIVSNPNILSPNSSERKELIE